MKTITQYTVDEVLKDWSKATNSKMTQSDLARALEMNRQQICALKTKPIPTKYNEKTIKFLQRFKNFKKNIMENFFIYLNGSEYNNRHYYNLSFMGLDL